MAANNVQMKNRARTAAVKIGDIAIGGENPIAIQSMTNTDTRDISKTIEQIASLRDAGCDIVRVAVVDMEAAAAVGPIKREIGMPLVADIHFDHRLAIECIKQGADKIRINPGNIGGVDNVKRVAAAAKSAGVPIRIGVNGGSLNRDVLGRHGGVTAAALVESALAQAETLNMCGFYDIVVSLKSSDVFLTVEACKLFAAHNTGIPQHIGITETGTLVAGAVKSAVGLYELLRNGIGDTIRVSLTSGDPTAEVAASRTLLSTLGIKNRASGHIELISCPTCGRCNYNMIDIAKEVDGRLMKMRTDKHLKVAVMGCAVNGPGEARDADIGVAGGHGKALFFKRGKPLYQVAERDLVDVLMREIADML